MTFQERVYEITNQIPKGKVATYGQIARLAGNSKAFRAVGMCMKRNPNNTITPCYRVVGADGKLTGYSGKGGIVTKYKMLQEEGVHFIKQRVNLTVSQWEV